MPHQPAHDLPEHGACIDLQDDSIAGGVGCESLDACRGPGFCHAADGTETDLGDLGVCSMWCVDDGNCPSGHCVPLYGEISQDMLGVCLRECFPRMDDCTGGLECGSLMGVQGMVCIPPAWNDMTVPLNGTMRMWM
jgi:hypothetical protein